MILARLAGAAALAAAERYRRAARADRDAAEAARAAAARDRDQAGRLAILAAYRIETAQRLERFAGRGTVNRAQILALYRPERRDLVAAVIDSPSRCRGARW